MKSCLMPSIPLNGFFQSLIPLLLIPALVLLFSPSREASAENPNNRIDSQFPELNYTEGEITVAQVEFDGIKRDFRYYVPENLDKTKKPPLILVLHGYNQPIDTIISGYSSIH